MPDEVVMQKLASMVGFHNVAGHACRRLDPTVVRTVGTLRPGDFRALGRELPADS